MKLNQEELNNDFKNMEISEVLKKYNLTFEEAFRLCLSDSNYHTKKKSHRRKLSRKQKYISQTGNYYYLRKSVEGILTNFGKYKSLADAVKVRNYFIENGWDYNKLDNVCAKLNVENFRK